MNAKLTEAMAAIDKQHGKGTIMLLGSSAKLDVKVIPSGSLAVDVAIGVGGFPRGRVVEIYGPECLDGETFIQYKVQTSGRGNSKGGTLQRLYERFNGLKVSGDGRGKSLRAVSRNAKFFASAINEHGRVIRQQISAVVYSGIKPCFSLSTNTNHSIVITGDHEFFTGTDYVKMKDLQIGDVVFIHNNTHFKVEKKENYNSRRHFVYVKHHPVAGIKNCGGYLYHRLKKSRAVMEAKINKLDFDTYIARLNSGSLENLKFIPREIDVHHKDEDRSNDALENLEMLHTSLHGRLHATKGHNNLRFVAIPAKITAIKPVGNRETYDIVMKEPYRNFIANGFVVHNSGGKTTLALHVIAQTQKLGGQAAFIDAEHALDPVYARALGVDTKNLLISQPDFGEQALEVVESLIKSGEVDIIVVDSVAALVPRAELEGDMGQPQMGLQARLMSQALRKLTAITSKSKVCLLFINQIRDKIGVMFGSPETTTGGRALKFYSSLRLDIRRMSTTTTDDIKTGNKTKVKVVKNKLAAPFKEAEIEIIFGQGISNETDILNIGAEKGIIEKSGSWYSYKGERIGQGSDTARDFLRANPPISAKIEADIRKIYFGTGDK